MNLDYHSKYLKYKSKFLTLQNQRAGKINIDKSTHLFKALEQQEINILKEERDKLLFLLTENKNEENTIFKTRIEEITEIFNCYDKFKTSTLNKIDTSVFMVYLKEEPYYLLNINDLEYKIPLKYLIELTPELKNEISLNQTYFDIYKKPISIPKILLPLHGKPKTDGKSKTDEKVKKSIPDNISIEIDVYKKLISTNIKKGYKIFLKGGFVHGFKLLQLLNNNKSLTSLEKIELTKKYIRDFDLTMDIPGTEVEFKDKDIIFACENPEMRKEGHIIFVYRYNKKYETPDGEAFIELSVVNGKTPYDHISNLELPLTSMTIEFNEENIELIFSIIEYYFKISQKTLLSEEDMNDLIQKTSQLIINVPRSSNGLFNVYEIDYSNLNEAMIGIINNTTSNNFIRQFLISHIIEPDRLFFRFYNKNIKKMKESLEILNFHNCYQNYIDEKNEWIVNDIKIINNTIKNFLKNINIEIKKLIEGKEINRNNLEIILKEVQEKLFTNINLGRLYDKIYTEHNINNIKNIYKLLNYLFDGIISSILLDEPNEINRMYIIISINKDTNLFKLYKLYLYLKNLIIIDIYHKI
jgi:hypothetical protein